MTSLPVAVEDEAPPPMVIGVYAALNVVRVKRGCAAVIFTNPATREAMTKKENNLILVIAVCIKFLISL